MPHRCSAIGDGGWLQVLRVVWLLLVASPCFAQTLAVLPFANQTGDASLDPLGRGLADMLMTDLSVVSSLTLVERNRLAELEAELALQASELVDPRTAAQRGRAIGASHLLVGSVVEMSPTIRIDARIIDVQSASVLLSASAIGPRADFFFLEKELADKVITALGLELSARQRAKFGRLPTESFPAFFAWSRGLDAQARGDAQAAALEIEQALAHDAGFAEASALLQRIRGRAERAGSASDEVFAAQVVELLGVMEQVKEGADPETLLALTRPYLQSTATLSARQRHIVAVRGLALGLTNTWTVNIAPGRDGRSFNEVMLYERVSAAFIAGLVDEVLAWGPTYTERYPGSPFAVGVRSMVQQALSYSTQRQRALQQVAPLRAAAHNSALQLRCEGAFPLWEQLEPCAQWLEHAALHEIKLGGHDVGAVRTAIYHLADPVQMERFAAIFATLPSRQDDAVFLQERRAKVQERRQDLPPREPASLVDDPRAALQRLRALQAAGLWQRWLTLADALLSRWAADDEHGARVMVEGLQGLSVLRDTDRGIAWRDVAAAHHISLTPVRRGWLEDVAQQSARAQWSEAQELYELASGLAALKLHEEAVAAYLELRQAYPDYPQHKADKALASAAHQAFTGLYPWHHEVSRALYRELAAQTTDPMLKELAASMLALPAR